MPRTTHADRSKRQHRLLELLREGFVGTQDEIVGRLRREGLNVTQTTVSRDLDDLGAVRHRQGHRSVYGLPDRNGPPDGLVDRLFGELVRSVVASGNLIVVRTFPGTAPAVAAAIDAWELPGTLGTVQGDDTVLVVADERTGGKRLAERITVRGGVA